MTSLIPTPATNALRSIYRKSPLAVRLYRTAYQVRRYMNLKRAIDDADKKDAEFTRLDGCPLPPARLRHRVHGDLSAENFLVVGERVADNLRSLLTSVDRSFKDFGNILDFGCGCGRVLRNLNDLPNSSELHGTDIDPALVNWCRENIPWAKFTVNSARPPSPLADSAFDMIYAISVFTHLPEDMQHQWLAELSRITRPGGIVILTFHGRAASERLNADGQSALLKKGFLYLVGETGKLKLDGLPDFYQTTYHTFEYIAREWSRYFSILKHVPQAINGHQDAVILQKL